jgi:hypothetical protein
MEQLFTGKNKKHYDLKRVREKIRKVVREIEAEKQDKTKSK